MTTSTAHPAALALLGAPRFRFTIREAGGRELRKRMTAARFLSKRAEYAGRVGIRVDVLDTESGEVQVWSIDLGKYYGAR